MFLEASKEYARYSYYEYLEPVQPPVYVPYSFVITISGTVGHFSGTW